MRHPRVAVVHDWLLTWEGGSERVVAEMLKAFPNADVFALLEGMPKEQREFLDSRRVTTSFIQKIPGARRHYRHLLPLMPLAVESLDLSGYDLVLSSSHAVAKGVLTGPAQMHICYCHTPIRYAWDLQNQYLSEANLNKGLRKYLALLLLHYMRQWDLRTSPGVDYFISNSEHVARRIQKVYRRDSETVYPPVDTHDFSVGHQRDDFYVVVARLVPYKRVGLLLKAFELLPDRHLVVIGGGPMLDSLRASAPPNVEMLGRQPFESMRDHLQRARAFLYAAEEDFGISIVEAQSCGTPVITYRAGGALETVIDGRTGVFFDEQTPTSVAGAVRRFESLEAQMRPGAIRHHALSFSASRFRSAYRSFVIRCCLTQSFNPTLREWAGRETLSAQPVLDEAPVAIRGAGNGR